MVLAGGEMMYPSAASAKFLQSWFSSIIKPFNATNVYGILTRVLL